MLALILSILDRVCARGGILPDTELLDSGLLDSLAFIRLADELQTAGVLFSPARMPRAAFSTPRALAAALEKADGPF